MPPVNLISSKSFARGLNRRAVFGFFDFNLSGSGLISGQRLEQTLKEALGQTSIDQLELPYTAVATEIGTGHEVWLSRGLLVDAMRASYAIPGVFKPVRIDGRWLFDGALVNPIPVSVCRAMGAEYVIAVNLNCRPVRPRHRSCRYRGAQRQYAESPETTVSPKTNGWGARKLLQRQIFGRSGQGAEAAPSISTVMVDAFNIVHDRIARSRLAGDPPDIMISPRLSGFGLFEFHRASELIDRGVRAAERVLNDVRQDVEGTALVARPDRHHQYRRIIAGCARSAERPGSGAQAAPPLSRYVGTQSVGLHFDLGDVVLDDVTDRNNPDEAVTV